MHQRLLQVTQDLDAAHADLLGGYDAERLYNLRVATRRIRSILKQMDSHRARSLRKTWGGMAAVTSAARDWDVFLVTAETLLDDEAMAEFRALNNERVAFCHGAVLDMLRSATWQRHRREWENFLTVSEETPQPDGSGAAALENALHRSRRRLQRALEKDSDRDWHKFRIAVKEVRYTAEANPGLPGSEQTVQECKDVQALLGDWHDTVVQLGLLEELPPVPVHAQLGSLVRSRKADFLAQIRSRLSGETLFSPIPE